MKRIIVSILIVIIACMVHSLVVYADSRVDKKPAAEISGPPLGNWEFIGKDDKGIAWTGILEILKLDTNRFDADKYHSIASLGVKSENSGHGVEAPCRWEPGRREISFSTGGTSYAAILSPDGKSLTQGTWTESEKDFRTRKVTVTRTGVWSAKFTAP